MDIYRCELEKERFLPITNDEKFSKSKEQTENNTDHVERKVPKYENHKLRERKVKTLTRN